MRAMVLAAGLGTRLRPLTDDRPKALVEINGRTLLEMTLERLGNAGVTDVIVNAHHFADKLIGYLAANRNFGMRIEVSREEVLLDTGGGLKKAAGFFLEDGSAEPFFLHNVDVLSAIDLSRMLHAHRTRGALATLAVQHRKTSRYLLFDSNGQLCGRRKEQTGDSSGEELVRNGVHSDAVAFSGVHVISPALLKLMTEEGAFSIIDCYLRLAAAGHPILAFNADDYYWRDLGKPEHLQQAALDLERGIVS